jgi:hypothetical protein
LSVFHVALGIYDGDYSQGVANNEYFLPGNMHRATLVYVISHDLVGPASNLNIRKTLVEQHTPEIVVHGLVNNNDVEKLFDM